jgi:hypothetical protein
MSVSNEISEELKSNHGYYMEDGDEISIFKKTTDEQVFLYFARADQKGEVHFGFNVNGKLSKEKKNGLLAILNERIKGKDYPEAWAMSGWIYSTVYDEGKLDKKSVIEMMKNLENDVANNFEQAIEAGKNKSIQDEQAKAEKWQMSLTSAVRDLWIYSLLITAGIIVFAIGRNVADGLNFLIYVFVSFVLAGFPTLVQFAKGGFTKDFFYYQHVEIITKYKDGSKSSDGGLLSLPINMGAWFLVGLFLIWLFAPISVIKFGYLCIKYVISLVVTKEKSILSYSGFIPVLLLVIAWIIVF